MSVDFLTFVAADEATGLASLGINFKALLLQAGTFVILYFLFKKYALGKVVKTLADRRQKIDEGLTNADLMEKQLAELHDKTEAELKAARVEAEAVIAKAHEEAGHVIAEAEQAAAKRAESLIADARRTSQANADKIKRELKGEMLELVATATSNVLDEKIDASKDKKLIENALSGARND